MKSEKKGAGEEKSGVSENREDRIAPDTKPDERIAPGVGFGASDVPGIPLPKRTLTKRQKIGVGIVAGFSVLVIAVSSFFLMNPQGFATFFTGDVFQTTQHAQDDSSKELAESQSVSSQDTAQDEGASADVEAPNSANPEVPSSDLAGATASSSGTTDVVGDGADGMDGAASSGQSPAPERDTSSHSADGSTPPPAAPATITVSVSVSSSAVSGSVSGGANPTFSPGATAYDALCATGLSVNASNSTYGVYVSAIGGLAEKEYSGNSGWLYSVNGDEPGVSCSSYVLHDGDSVQWYYRP